MNARTKLSPVAAEMAKIHERRRTLGLREAKLVSELEPLSSKCSTINAASPTTEEYVEALLDRTAENGDRLFYNNVPGFVNKRGGKIAALGHESAILSEIDASGALQYQASSEAVSFLLTQPEMRPRAKARLMETLPAIEGALSSEQRAELLRPIKERMAEIDAELETIRAELAELSFDSAA